MTYGRELNAYCQEIIQSMFDEEQKEVHCLVSWSVVQKISMNYDYDPLTHSPHSL